MAAGASEEQSQAQHGDIKGACVPSSSSSPPQALDILSMAGGQGSVTMGILHGVPVVVKTYELTSKRSFRRENRAARRMRNAHPHVVRYFSTEAPPDLGGIMMLQPALCDLHDLLCMLNGGSSFGEHAFMREWMLQIAHALAFAHSQGVAHRDVKLENILLFTHTHAAKPHATLPQATAHRHAHLAALRALASQVLPHGTLPTDTSHALRQYMVKLCDFGSAFVAAEDAPPGTARGMSPQGSTPFSCPEIVCLYTAATSPETASACWPTDAAPVTLGKEGYNPYAADVWSFGVTLFVMACGHTPFRAAAPFSRTFRAFVASTQPHILRDDIMGPQSALWAEGGHLPPWHWPQGMSPALAHLLGGCLAVRVEERLSMEEVKAHAWFANPEWLPGADSDSATSMPFPEEGEPATCITYETEGPPSPKLPPTAQPLLEGFQCPPVDTRFHAKERPVRGVFHALHGDGSGSPVSPQLPAQGSGEGMETPQFHVSRRRVHAIRSNVAQDVDSTPASSGSTAVWAASSIEPSPAMGLLGATPLHGSAMLSADATPGAGSVRSSEWSSPPAAAMMPGSQGSPSAWGSSQTSSLAPSTGPTPLPVQGRQRGWTVSSAAESAGGGIAFASKASSGSP